MDVEFPVLINKTIPRIYLAPLCMVRFRGPRQYHRLLQMISEPRTYDCPRLHKQLPASFGFGFGFDFESDYTSL